MFKKTTNFQLFLLSLVLALGLISCKDRSINPFEDNRGVFSVYGALEVGKNPNIVRVRNLSEPFYSDTSLPINATVTFTDLSTGETTELRDSVVIFTGNKTHNFILNEDLKLDTQYEITVQGNDGKSVTSIATTPGLTKAYYVRNAEFIQCETSIDFRFDNVRPPEFVQMEVGVLYQGEYHWAPLHIVGHIEYDSVLDMMTVKMSPRNLLVEVFPPILPDNPYFNPYFLLPTVSCDELDSRKFMIRYKHFGPEWAKGQPQENGPIDIESGEIDNGLGFFGAYRTDTLSFELRDPDDSGGF